MKVWISICSIHYEKVANCLLCNISVEDVLPDYIRKKAEAEKAGLHTCTDCGFEYYKVTQWCPRCNNGSS